MKPTTVRSLPLHKPIILQKNSTLKQAAQAMKNNGVGSVLVSDGHGLLKGIFTDRDLALALAIENMPPKGSLEDATRNRLVYVTETATLQDVVNTMQQFAIRRVPVVHMRPNGKQRCLGIISLDDLIKEGLIDASEESAILKSQLDTSNEKIGRGRIKSIFHTQDNREHSFHTFIKTVETKSGLNKGKAQLLTQDTLTLLLKRLPAKAGKNLLSQLPYELQMQLLSYVSPADRNISSKNILSHTQKRFHASPEEAQTLLQKFWSALEDSVSAGVLKGLSRELPREIMSLFIQKEKH